MKARSIFELVYEQNYYNLNKKTISIWFFDGQNKNDFQNAELAYLINQLIASGADINIYVNDTSAIDNLPTDSVLNYFDNKLDCLFHSETLIILGEFFNLGTPNENKIAEKIRTGLVVDCGFNFGLKCFMPYKINYISF